MRGRGTERRLTVNLKWSLCLLWTASAKCWSLGCGRRFSSSRMSRTPTNFASTRSENDRNVSVIYSVLIYSTVISVTGNTHTGTGIWCKAFIQMKTSSQWLLKLIFVSEPPLFTDCEYSKTQDVLIRMLNSPFLWIIHVPCCVRNII